MGNVMENLFFLVVVLIIIVSNVVSIRKRIKTQQSGRAGEKQAQASGWKASIEKMLNQLKEELDPESGKPARREQRSSAPGEILFEEAYEQPGAPAGQAPAGQASTGQASIRQRGESKIDRAYRMKEAREDRVGTRERQSDAQAQHRVAMAEKTPEAATADDSRQKAAVPEETPAEEFAHLSADTYSVAQLQRAVIWSEILGPPVALQKERREVW